MADTGVLGVWAAGKKVGGDMVTGKPRGMATPKDQAVLGVWFSSPLSHFAELGTVKERARPFLTPALARNLGDVGPYVTRAIDHRAKRRAARAARIAAAGDGPMSLPDPTGRLLTEIRDDAGVAALTTRVRGGEPAAGDALGAGQVPAVRGPRPAGAHAPPAGPDPGGPLRGPLLRDDAPGRGRAGRRRVRRGPRPGPPDQPVAACRSSARSTTAATGRRADPDTGQPYEVVLITVGALTETLPIA